MKRQFQHEAHNRQERVWKERGTGGPHGGSDYYAGAPQVHQRVICFDASARPPRVWWRYHYNADLDRRQIKVRLLAAARDLLRKECYRIQGYRYKFTYRLDNFARANNLSIEVAKHVFPGVQAEAVDRFRLAISHLQKQPLRWRSEETPEGWQRVHYIPAPRLAKILPPDG